LARRRAKELDDWNQRFGDLKDRNADELRENKRHHAELEAELARHINRLNIIQGGLRAPQRRRRGAPNIPMDEGFSGFVQGPANIQIGPGTEYIYASGIMGGARQPVLPGAAAAQVQAMKASVSGNVGVPISGLNSELMERIGPSLRDTIGQGIIDSLTEMILRM
jgi:hypothetical protein